MLTLDKVFDASNVLKEVIRPTACIHAPKVNPDCDVYLKTENLQVTGSFKVRGAYYKISQLSDEEKSHGVIACSAGNHAQGVALAATKNGIKSIICLPDGAPISKVEATKGYGAEVCLVPGVYDDAYAKAIELRDANGYTFIHPFDDENVIAGQGTIGLEILSQVADADVIVVPVGGGGLISGVAFTVKQLKPSVRVYGVQAEGAPSMVNSLKDGKIECLESVHTIADGIKVKEPGEHTFEYCSKYVDGVVTVSDDEISSAILHLIEAYTELYKADHNEEVAKRLKFQLGQMRDIVYTPETNALKVFFDTKFDLVGDIHSFGHDIEATWLMDLACDTLGDEELKKQFAEMDLKISHNIQNIALDNGALNNERENDKIDKKRVWWVEAESVVGFINAYQHSGEKKFLESARSVWEYIKAEIIDKREGSEWYAEVSYDHKPHDWKEIVGPWKCPYHNGRMCMEVINRGVDF